MPGPAWNTREKALLQRQVKRERRALADVEIPDRSINAIRAQAVRSGLVQKRASRQEWSQEQRDQLKALKQQGFMPQEIFLRNLLGPPQRTKWSIGKQWGRLKLADRRRSRRMKRRKRWTPEEREKFTSYLLRYSKTKTPEQIAEHWNVARSTVCRWQHRLGVKESRATVMQMPYSREKQSQAQRRIQQASRRSWKRRIKQREVSLRAMANELRNGAQPLSERACADCGESWPKRRKFFPYHDKKSSFGTSRYFKHRCILCENARRRAKRRVAGNGRK